MFTVATDCSGIEAPLQALKQMKVKHRHLWSCDNDKFVKESIDANYKPEHFFTDMRGRDIKTLPKDSLDLYVCGFPCQPFSLMGNKLGTKDIRGNIMMECIKVIKSKLPKIFVLENVKNFKSIQEGKPFKYLINELEGVRFDRQPAYKVYYDVLNTRDYGIPQNRERIFIFGIRQDVHKRVDGEFVEYKIPKTKRCKPLSSFVLDTTVSNHVPSKSLENNLSKIRKGYNTKSLGDYDFIVTPFTFYYPMKDICPTLTTNCSCFYHTRYKRPLEPKELLLLQGFPKGFRQVVSKTQMCKQIGNSMSVCVLKALFKQIFSMTNLKLK
jgi:DNA (cytosine-5)-methyltransferase 1